MSPDQLKVLSRRVLESISLGEQVSITIERAIRAGYSIGQREQVLGEKALEFLDEGYESVEVSLEG